MEEAGKQAKGKFREGAKDLGRTITDDLSQVSSKAKDTFSGVGKHITDVFQHSGRDAASTFTGEFEAATKGKTQSIGEDLAEVFGDAFGTELGRAAGDLAKNIPGVDMVADHIDEIRDAAEHARGGLQNVHDVIGSLRGGDVGGALGGVSGALEHIDGLGQHVGVDITGWTGPLQDVLGKSTEMSGDISEFAGLIKELPGPIGAVGAALGEWAIPIAAAAFTATQMYNQIKEISALPPAFSSPIQGPPIVQTPAAQMPLPGQQQPAAPPPGAPPGVTYRATPGSLDPFAALLPPGVAAPPPAPPVISPPPGGLPSPPPVMPAPAMPSLAPPDMPDNAGPPQHPTTSAPSPSRPRTSAPAPPPAPIPPAAAAGPSGAPPPAPIPRVAPSHVTSGASSPDGLVAAGSRVANLYAFANSLVGTPYSQALRNDCSGMVAQLAAVAVGLPPPSAGERFSTPNEQSWLMSHGFQMGQGGPGDLRIGWNPAPGNEGHTAATLPGGEHAESGGSHGNFVIGPGAAGAEDRQFSMHAFLPMGSGGGPSSVRAASAAGPIPVGTEHDPLYVTPSTAKASGKGAGGDDPAKQFGQDFLGGILQIFGLDGTLNTFGPGRSPLDFGVTKLFQGVMRSLTGGGAGGAGGGGMAGGDGAAMPGLGGLIPGLANVIPTPHGGGAGGAPPGPPVTNIFNGPYQPGQFVANGVGGVQEQQEQYNAMQGRSYALSVNLPMAGG